MKILYHVTPKENVRSILKNGLIPSNEFVYLSEDPYSWYREGLSIIEVNIEDIDVEMYTSLPRLDEIIVCGRVEPNRLKLYNS